MSFSENIKIIILGAPNVGKTSLFRSCLKDFREIEDRFLHMFSPDDSKIKVGKKVYYYSIWDYFLKGPKDTDKIIFNNTKIIIVVYSINDKNSFKEVPLWIQFAKESLGKNKYIMALVANKSDLFMDEEVIEEEEGKEMANKYEMDFLLTNTKYDGGVFKNFVNKLFMSYIKKYC